ncbi:MAG: hypothetical protein COB85_06560 [Bacteroidetes bacterium]|nr:MAG: hypothetical protein COB85_06560 [Bacteroidota bacterium]
MLTRLIILSAMLVVASCQKDECKKRPKVSCGCTFQYNPVCGCNGETYGNPCMAKCDRITYTMGECI